MSLDYLSLLAGPMIGFSIFVLLLGIFQIVCLWLIFEKAGEEGWKSIIPIYNLVVLCRIVNIDPLWVLLILVPYLGALVLGIWICIELARAFGQGGGFAVGLVLLTVIFMAILAFGNYQYVRPFNGFPRA